MITFSSNVTNIKIFRALDRSGSNYEVLPLKQFPILCILAGSFLPQTDWILPLPFPPKLTGSAEKIGLCSVVAEDLCSCHE